MWTSSNVRCCWRWVSARIRFVFRLTRCSYTYCTFAVENVAQNVRFQSIDMKPSAITSARSLPVSHTNNCAPDTAKSPPQNFSSRPPPSPPTTPLLVSPVPLPPTSTPPPPPSRADGKVTISITKKMLRSVRLQRTGNNPQKIKMPAGATAGNVEKEDVQTNGIRECFKRSTNYFVNTHTTLVVFSTGSGSTQRSDKCVFGRRRPRRWLPCSITRILTETPFGDTALKRRLSIFSME